jgi:hypothetical protein
MIKGLSTHLLATTYQTKDGKLVSIGFRGERQNVVVHPVGATNESEY